MHRSSEHITFPEKYTHMVEKGTQFPGKVQTNFREKYA
jgi:hypothetical protein